MANRYATLGVDSDYSPNWGIRQDEFVPDLRGQRGIKRLREMATNDPVIGALLSAMDLMIRAVPWRIEGGSEQARELLEYSLYNMENTTFEMFISDVLSCLPYGFAVFEIVARPPSRHPEGWVTLHRLAPRAQWTIERFEVNERGDILGVWQTATTKSGFIPYSKLLHFRTASRQNDPAGMSVLRSAYRPWYYGNRIQEIEAVAIERELNGLPLVRIPAEYLAEDASPDQRAFVSKIAAIARDVKRNEQGYIIIPSDPYIEDATGKISNMRLVEFELIASQGKRDISTHEVIIRYQQDMARSALADFVMLGTNDRGSFALSQSKADLFLKALEGYMDAIASVLNRQLVPKLCDWNGVPVADRPKMTHGRVAPTNLDELGTYIDRLTGSGIDVNTDLPTVNQLRGAAGLPPTEKLPEPKPAPVMPGQGPNAPSNGQPAPGETPRRGRGRGRGRHLMLTADRTRDDPSLSKASSAEPIYMYRPVLNAEEILTWAASQGFTSALEPDDMHVTVVFSRRPFSIDYSESARSHSAIGYSNIVVQDDARSVVPLGDKGAVVLKLTSDELQTEHAYFCEQGASWDYPEYQPHVTITYQGGDLPIARVEPFTGPIILGPLRAKPLNTGAGDDVKEVNLLKRQLDDDIFTLSYEAVSRSMALGLDGRIHAHQTADGQAVYMPGASQQEYLSLYARQAESPDMVSRRWCLSLKMGGVDVAGEPDD